MPQPRLTYAPSGSSSAARSAICSRVRRDLGIAQSFRNNDAFYEDGRRDDDFGIKAAGGDEIFDFDERGLACGGHDGIEIARSLAINEIAQMIGALRTDKSIIGTKRVFENVALAANHALFFAAGYLGAHADGGIKGRNAGAKGAYAFAENSLWNEFEFDFAGVILLLKIFRAGTGKGGDDATNLAIFEENAGLAVTGATIVADDFEIARATAGQGLDQIIGGSGPAEAPQEERSAGRE